MRVRYGPDETPTTREQSYVDMEDTTSITAHGLHEVTIITRLESSAEATLRGALTLERGAQPQWELGDIDVFWEALDPGTAALLSGALPGQRIQVLDLPDPGPANVFEGCVEGWDERWANIAGLSGAAWGGPGRIQGDLGSLR